MSRHLKPVWNQRVEALDATEEVKRVVAGRAKKVMVMLAVLGLVPNAAAQPLDRFQRAFLNTPLESAVYRGETDTRSAQAAPQFPGGQGAVRLVKGSQDGHLLLRSLHELHDKRFSVIVKDCFQHGSLVPGPRAGTRRTGRADARASQRAS